MTKQSRTSDSTILSCDDLALILDVQPLMQLAAASVNERDSERF